MKVLLHRVHLVKERDGLKDELRRNDADKLANHPVVKNFQSVFHQFPQLYDVLSEETTARHEESTQDPISLKRKRNTDVNSPKKDKSFRGDHPPVFQHQMFDESIAQFIDTNILTSPSKARRRMKDTKYDEDAPRNQVLLENVYRMFGITYFPVVDPTDLKVNKETNKTEINREMIGIRLEVFNESIARFEKPYYILLKKKIKSDSWLLFKHTVPIFIDVHALFNKTNGGAIISHENIYLFAKTVYRQLIELTARMQNLEDLMSSGVIDNLDLDLEAAAVSFSKNEVQFRLMLHKDQIVSCSLVGEALDGNVKPQLETIFLGPLHELEIKLKHLDQL